MEDFAFVVQTSRMETPRSSGRLYHDTLDLCLTIKTIADAKVSILSDKTTLEKKDSKTPIPATELSQKWEGLPRRLELQEQHASSPRSSETWTPLQRKPPARTPKDKRDTPNNGTRLQAWSNTDRLNTWRHYPSPARNDNAQCPPSLFLQLTPTTPASSSR